MRSAGFVLSCLFLSFLLGDVRAQVLRPVAESAFEPQHHFNPSFISSKGIKKIVFEIVDKKDFEIAEDNSLTETYEFLPDGRLSRHYYTVVARAVERQVTTVGRKGQSVTRTTNDYLYDTVSTWYHYNGDKLALKRYHDGRNYYESRYFRYDNGGNLTKELRYRETNVSSSKSIFILGSQTLLGADSFQCQKFSSGQLKCVYLNNENRPYKERITNYDTEGRTVDIYETYTAASWITQHYTFSYQAGRLSHAAFEGNAGKPVKLAHLYEYDETGELYWEKQYRDSTLVREVSFVTDKLNMLLNSFVIRDHVLKSMRIVKLKYDFGMVTKSDGRRL